MMIICDTYVGIHIRIYNEEGVPANVVLAHQL